MKKNKTLLMILGIILIVSILSVYAFLQQKKTNEVVGDEIMTQLLTPYTQLLAEKKFEEAYKKFTSPSYQYKFSLEDFVNKQQENHEYYGTIQTIELFSGIILREKPQGQPWIYKTTLKYIGESNSERIEMDIVIEDGKYLIYRTYRSFVTIKSINPEVF